MESVAMRKEVALMRECPFDPGPPGLSRASTPDTTLPMNRALRTLLFAVAVAAVGLLVLSWVVQAALGRMLTVGEWLAACVALAVAVSLWVQTRRQRDRRRIEDMRDSALW